MLFLFVAVIGWSIHCAASSLSVTPCNPASYICHGRCPPLPDQATLPPPEKSEGLCLLDSNTDACVCWLWNPSADQHLQTLFKCDVPSNATVKQVACLPPPFCFPPGPEPGCLIIPFCPCTRFGRGAQYAQWKSVVAFIYRSKVVVEPETDGVDKTTLSEDKPASEPREFNLKHLFFLLAFVIAPLCCWCLLTFFHEGKCQKRLRTPVPRRVTITDNPVPEPPPQPPTAPKLESPPPYEESTADPAQRCLLPSDCGPPPSYEDAVQCQWQLMLVPRIPQREGEAV